MLFKDLVDDWWTYYPRTVKATTALRIDSNIKIIRKKIPGNYLIDRIDTPYLQKIIDELYYTDNYSTSTTKQIKSALVQLFTFATERKGYFETNPAKSINIKPTSHSEIKKWVIIF